MPRGDGRRIPLDVLPGILRQSQELRRIDRRWAGRTIARNANLTEGGRLLFLRRQRLRRYAYENRMFRNLRITEMIEEHIDGDRRPTPLEVARLRTRLRGRRYRNVPWYPRGTSPLTDYNYVMWHRFRIRRGQGVRVGAAR